MTNKIRRKALLGYADKLTARPREKISFKISSEKNEPYNAQLVRLVNGDVHSPTATYKEIEIDSPVNRMYCGRHQRIAAGSCIVVDRKHLEDSTDQMAVALNVYPTTPLHGEQHLICRWNDVLHSGWTLHLNKHGHLSLRIRARGTSLSVSLDAPLKQRQWYHVAASVNWTTSRALIICAQNEGAEVVSKHGIGRSTITECRNDADSELLMAAALGGRDALGRVIPVGCFNGRIEAPVIYAGMLTDREVRDVLLGARPTHLTRQLLADWDFSRGADGDIVYDCSENAAHGRTYNLPLRAVRGTRWNGTTMEWPNAPEQYSAIHFHCDDLYDCGWLTDIELSIPDNLRSGIYALRLRNAACEEHIPFFVAAPKRSPQAAIALLIPTYTYLAYGNFHNMEVGRKQTGMSLTDYYSDKINMMGPGSQEYAVTIEEHYDLGLSLYDQHIDGSPVHFSSWLRPLLSLRPKSILWTLCADLLLTDWLEEKNFPYDVITDELVHQEGLGLLKEYRVIITGNHPEYYTTEQLKAVASYPVNGGRLMYLGGNGFYWRIGVHQRFPAAIEVRRGRSGTATHRSGVGESSLAFTGEVGGIWRDLGHPPQKSVGVGFIAQGAGSSYYRVLPEVRDGAAAFMLKGVDTDILGNFGIFGGAAGQEIDRTNLEYGTPDNAIIVARSENHADEMLCVIEEMLGNYPVPEHYRSSISAEMVLFSCANKGAVFSVGSMTWCGSLGHNNYLNNISVITENVLRHFLED
ncbi:N,N-dimethylformamidase beta subunit family domain-containing protein [Steroidobacter cummioxidans]|uniref:N,N-dimethylformamidase beta subunit family domain-containing protein n=1 Tax=Steroidobacter cummioxidans TaxID=1803913 RepID=UPI0012901B5D|nr:N,N-dimethylformamidase beta subunit family domain-containing protein [Steroidobacter cummioxidans]